MRELYCFHGFIGLKKPCLDDESSGEKKEIIKHTFMKIRQLKVFSLKVSSYKSITLQMFVHGRRGVLYSPVTDGHTSMLFLFLSERYAQRLI